MLELFEQWNWLDPSYLGSGTDYTLELVGQWNWLDLGVIWAMELPRPWSYLGSGTG